MGLTKVILNFAAPIPKIEKMDRFLFIGPHPDDIEIGAGATAAKLVAAGKTVRFLVCIDGRFGTGNAPEGVSGDKLVELRQIEARNSALKLGVKDVQFLGFCDGGFYEQKDLIVEIAKVVGEFQPDVIFAPDPCVTSECHIDHLNVGNAAKQIAYFAPYKEIMEQYGAVAAPVKALAYYMTAKPTQYIKTSGYLKKQIDAIFSCHLSQFPEGCGDAQSIPLYLRLRAIDFGLRSLKGCAEGFRVLGVTQMHCLPEAGK
ncbi:MAG: PIG-L family deacetylase [Lachnospiraceae bacterium]|nr:PIG-L family deacetylase [Lachnospiraceae bacterium]